VGLLSEMRQRHGTAILLICHDPALVVAFADRVAVMNAGRIVEAGTSTEMFARPLHPYTQAFVRLARSSVGAGAGAKGRFPGIEGGSLDPITGSNRVVV
jgi:peptide/nickel transport system ATP-binding protein